MKEGLFNFASMLISYRMVEILALFDYLHFMNFTKNLKVLLSSSKQEQSNAEPIEYSMVVYLNQMRKNLNRSNKIQMYIDW